MPKNHRDSFTFLFSQKYLISPAKKLGFEGDRFERGVCFGLMVIWFSYINDGDDTLFYANLKLLFILDRIRLSHSSSEISPFYTLGKRFLKQVVEAQVTKEGYQWLKSIGFDLHLGIDFGNVGEVKVRQQLIICAKALLSEKNLLEIEIYKEGGGGRHVIGAALRGGWYRFYDANNSVESIRYRDVEEGLTAMLFVAGGLAFGSFEETIKVRLCFYEKNSQETLMKFIEELEKFPLYVEHQELVSRMKAHSMQEIFSVCKIYEVLSKIAERLIASPRVSRDKTLLISLNEQMKQSVQAYQLPPMETAQPVPETSLISHHR
ncbi:MAG: hypothetical protein K0S08_538 [Gammaproteobacteria bacterium]|jgi:hypothetical protein|nr:hypothetical protein [Gammaproteobacteria bacterium]